MGQILCWLTTLSLFNSRVFDQGATVDCNWSKLGPRLGGLQLNWGGGWVLSSSVAPPKDWSQPVLATTFTVNMFYYKSNTLSCKHALVLASSVVVHCSQQTIMRSVWLPHFWQWSGTWIPLLAQLIGGEGAVYLPGLAETVRIHIPLIGQRTKVLVNIYMTGRY